MSAALQQPPAMVAIIEATHAQHLKPASDRWVAALRQVRANPTDPDHAIVAAILALEDMAGAAKDTAAVLRRELAVSMVNDGVTGFETDHHIASRVQAAQRAQMTDSKAFLAAHPDLAVPQDPKPDLAEAAKRLKRGERLVGCELSNGGADTLRLTAKKV